MTTKYDHEFRVWLDNYCNGLWGERTNIVCNPCDEVYGKIFANDMAAGRVQKPIIKNPPTLIVTSYCPPNVIVTVTKDDDAYWITKQIVPPYAIQKV